MNDIETDQRSRDLPTCDFYADWALSQFGSEVAQQAADLFTKLDGGPITTTSGQSGTNLPRPSTWVEGPGGINPDNRRWEDVKGDYAFVDEFEALRGQVKGKGNLERFDYWLNNFRYLRAIGKLNCIWARFNDAMGKAKEQKDSNEKKRMAQETVLPIRKELVRQYEEVQKHLLATVNTTGSMGNVMNWQQHLMPNLLEKPGVELAEMLGRKLTAAELPEMEYNGQMKLVVPTVRSSLEADEGLKLKVIVLGSGEVVDAALYYRQIGAEEFRRAALRHIDRGVYSVTLEPDQIMNLDFEYYVKVKQWNGEECLFPATAPSINKTVVIMN